MQGGPAPGARVAAEARARRAEDLRSQREGREDARLGRKRDSRERREALAGVRRADRQLARDLAEAEIRTVRAAAAAARALRGEAGRRGARRMRIAWARPPRADEIRLRPAPRGRPAPGGGGGVRTVHFALGSTGSGEAAAAHQDYIERERACVESFGNLDESFGERIRLWQEIGKRATTFRGSVTLVPGCMPALKRALRDEAPRLAAEGLMEPREAEALALLPDSSADDAEVFVRTSDKKAHDRLVRWLGELDKRLREDGLADRSAHPAPRKAAPWLPAGVRDIAPRETIVQRRLVAELAHEIPLERQAAALRRWCRENLEAQGIAYHAVIHRPENRNDPRNWHAHVVMATIPCVRRADGSGWEFEDLPEGKLPKVAPAMQDLRGNGPRKRQGARDLVKSWRRSWAEHQNRELKAVGAGKRYDPRSYRDMGVERTPGEHMGPKRHAMERRGEADHWNPSRPDWEAPDPADGPLRDHAAAAREEIRLMAGLARQGCGPGHPVWEALERAFASEDAGDPGRGRRDPEGAAGAEREDSEDSKNQEPEEPSADGTGPAGSPAGDREGEEAQEDGERQGREPEGPAAGEAGPAGDLEKGFRQWMKARAESDARWRAAWAQAKGTSEGWALMDAAQRLETQAGGRTALETMAERGFPEAREALSEADRWREEARPWRERWERVRSAPSRAERDRLSRLLAEGMKRAGIARPRHALGAPAEREMAGRLAREARHEAASADAAEAAGRMQGIRDPERVRLEAARLRKAHGRWLRIDRPDGGVWLDEMEVGWTRAATLRAEWDRIRLGAPGSPLCAPESFGDPEWTRWLAPGEAGPMLRDALAQGGAPPVPEAPSGEARKETAETTETAAPTDAGGRLAAGRARVMREARSPEEADAGLAGLAGLAEAPGVPERLAKGVSAAAARHRARARAALDAARGIGLRHRRGESAEALAAEAEALLAGAGAAGLLPDRHLTRLEAVLKEAGRPDAATQEALRAHRKAARRIRRLQEGPEGG